MNTIYFILEPSKKLSIKINDSYFQNNILDSFDYDSTELKIILKIDIISYTITIKSLISIFDINFFSKNWENYPILIIKPKSKIILSNFSIDFDLNFLFINKKIFLTDCILQIGYNEDVSFNNFLTINLKNCSIYINSIISCKNEIIIKEILYIDENGLIQSEESFIKVKSIKNEQINLIKYPIIKISKIPQFTIDEFNSDILRGFGFFGEKTLLVHLEKFSEIPKSKILSGKMKSEKGIDLITSNNGEICLYEAKCNQKNLFLCSKKEDIEKWFRENLKNIKNFHLDFLNDCQNTLLNNKNSSRNKLIKILKKKDQCYQIINLLDQNDYFIFFSSVYFEKILDEQVPTYILIRKKLNSIKEKL